MSNRVITHVVLFAALAVTAGPIAADDARPIKKLRSSAKIAGRHENAPLEAFWVEPVDIAGRDLINGQGGKEHRPAAGDFSFGKEDMNASSPKFDVHDAKGAKWKVKLGDEARPETVATRLVWAVGFHTDEDYFLPAIRVSGMPEHVRRGRKFIDADGTMHGARLERDIPGQKKAGNWKWKDDPFTGTRELNGLRVMMALINNWDLKDVNNGIYEEKRGGSLYVVTDLGASFGPSRLDFGHNHDKGDLKKYQRTGFIRHRDAEFVSFEAPAPPVPLMFITFGDYFRRRHLVWIGRDIPVEDARWMGSILAKLSLDQIRDAFRAGGYSAEEVEAFTAIVRQRIADLNSL